MGNHVEAVEPCSAPRHAGVRVCVGAPCTATPLFGPGKFGDKAGENGKKRQRMGPLERPEAFCLLSCVFFRFPAKIKFPSRRRGDRATVSFSETAGDKKRNGRYLPTRCWSWTCIRSIYIYIHIYVKAAPAGRQGGRATRANL